MYYRWAFIPLIWRLFSYLHIRRFRFLMMSNPTNPANLSNPLPSFRECKTFMMTYKWHMIAISTNPLPLSFPSHLFIERCPIFYCCHFLVKKMCYCTIYRGSELLSHWSEFKWIYFEVNGTEMSSLFARVSHKFFNSFTNFPTIKIHSSVKTILLTYSYYAAPTCLTLLICIIVLCTCILF